MKLAIVQLGDVHIKGGNDAILGRASAIARAVRAHTIDVSHYIMAITGDLAFSGKREQFELCGALLAQVEAELRDRRGVAVERIAIPGNHDCDFETEGDARPALLASVLARLDGLDPTGQTVLQMTHVQKGFFEFEGQYSNALRAGHENRLSYSKAVSVGDKSIELNGYNTAWCSRIEEYPAQLCFPTQFVRSEGTADLVISLFHHPYNWLEPNNSRAFRQAVEAGSDIILTGHEHMTGAFVKREIASDATEYYLEGGALVDGSANRSSFLVLTLDLEVAEFEVTGFDWNGELYQSRRSEKRPFARNRLACKRRFINTASFAARVNAPGVGFSHPRVRNGFALSDLFVYPDMAVRPVDQKPKSSPRVIRSDEAPSFFRTNDRVLVIGEQESGKSAMARMLYRELQQSAGLIPVLIEGDDIAGWRSADLRKVLRRAFEDQYDAAMWESFLQAPAAEKLLIIDSWEKVKYNPKGQAALITNASLEFGKIFCFSSDIVNVQLLIDPKEQRPVFFDFVECTILEMGKRLRGKLIERWHMLGREYTVQPQDLNHEVSISENKIDTLLGRNLLPAHPVVLLSLLQFDFDGATASNAGSYGHIYEALLTKRLAESSAKPTDIGTKYTYSSRIAYHLFKNESLRLTRDQLHSLHEEYCEQYQMRVNEAEMLEQLVKAQVLVQEGDNYRFRFAYCYYYFVAKYFQENLTTRPTLRREVMDLADKVNFDDYSQIVVFYLYLTNDQIIIDHIIGDAQRVYADQKPATLDQDVEFVNRLLSEPAKELSLPSIDIHANRDEYRQRQDEDEDDRLTWQHNWAKVAYDDSLDELTKINIALKYIRILGQVLRNFPGVLSGEQKTRLAQETYLLGLRLLGRLLGLTQTNLEELRRYFAEMIRIRAGMESSLELERSADEAVVWMSTGCAYGITKRISNAIGLEDLELTFAVVRNSLGEDKPSVRLTDVSIKLDHFRHAPEDDLTELRKMFRGNSFAAAILRQLVVDYLYLHCSDTKTLQRLAAQFRIKTGPAYLANKRTRQLAPAH